MSDIICAYAVSGGYGPISRYLYYALLLVSLQFHRREWLVGGTLGASMVYGSITAVHAIALASARGRGTVDLDIIPAFAITGVGMLVGAPMLIWSKTLREAPSSVRLVLFAWIGVMFLGVIASTASMKALPEPVECGIQGSVCGLMCDVTLPMRAGQSVIVVPFRWKSFLFDWSGYFGGYGSGFVLIGAMFAFSRRHPREMVREQLRGPALSRRLRRKNAGHVACCAYFSPILSVVLIVMQIIITEVILMGPQALPFGESMTAIGQWGPLVGAAFALLGSLIQWGFSDSEVEAKNPDAEEGRSVSLQISTTKDLEGAVAEGMSFSQGNSRWVIRDGLLRSINPTARISAPTPVVSTIPNSNPSQRFDVEALFHEGCWWGHGAEGLFMTHGGIKWVVHDGVLRQVLCNTGSRVSATVYSGGCHWRG